MEVKIPIPVLCLASRDIPPIPATVLNPQSDLRQLAAQAAIDIYALQRHAEAVAALLAQCAITQEPTH